MSKGRAVWERESITHKFSAWLTWGRDGEERALRLDGNSSTETQKIKEVDTAPGAQWGGSTLILLPEP